ncbi:hypothetical protein M758_UG196500 [Ceratodon purpureus]|nr:hypothetical protein M758_UG196500 [Ceratodon purpureus]
MAPSPICPALALRFHYRRPQPLPCRAAISCGCSCRTCPSSLSHPTGTCCPSLLAGSVLTNSPCSLSPPRIPSPSSRSRRLPPRFPPLGRLIPVPALQHYCHARSKVNPSLLRRRGDIHRIQLLSSGMFSPLPLDSSTMSYPVNSNCFPSLSDSSSWTTLAVLPAPTVCSLMCRPSICQGIERLYFLNTALDSLFPS